MTSPLPKRNLGPPNTDGLKKIAIFPAPSYKIRKKNSPPPQNKYLWVGGVYTMGNKATNTDYRTTTRLLG